MFLNVLIIGCSLNLELHCSYDNRLSRLRRKVKKFDPIHVLNMIYELDEAYINCVCACHGNCTQCGPYTPTWVHKRDINCD